MSSVENTSTSNEKSEPMTCVFCKQKIREDDHEPGWYIQWKCTKCGNAQCHCLQPKKAA